MIRAHIAHLHAAMAAVAHIAAAAHIACKIRVRHPHLILVRHPHLVLVPPLAVMVMAEEKGQLQAQEHLLLQKDSDGCC
jgi:hypothetical protein